MQPVYARVGYGPGGVGEDKGDVAGGGELLREVTELQERWDPLLEFTHHCSYQGRDWQNPQIYWVSNSSIIYY